MYLMMVHAFRHVQLCFWLVQVHNSIWIAARNGSRDVKVALLCLYAFTDEYTVARQQG